MIRVIRDTNVKSAEEGEEEGWGEEEEDGDGRGGGGRGEDEEEEGGGEEKDKGKRRKTGGEKPQGRSDQRRPCCGDRRREPSTPTGRFAQR